MKRNVEDEAAAGAAASRERCSEATLRGTYLFAYDGVDISGNAQVPFAGAGYEVFDGNGKVDSVVSANFDGEIVSKQPSSSKYTVKADCTGTITSPDGSIDLFIAPDGSMFTWVYTDPGVAASGVEQRVTRKRVGD